VHGLDPALPAAGPILLDRIEDVGPGRSRERLDDVDDQQRRRLAELELLAEAGRVAQPDIRGRC
jgi:hypothetical protein